jgi:gas vesicle protein
MARYKDHIVKERPKITEDVKKELLELRQIAKKKQENLPVTKNRIITATTQITPDYWKHETGQVSKYSGTIKEKAIKAYRDNQTLWSRFLGFFQSRIRRIKACLGIKTIRDDYNKWMDRY